MTPEFKPSSGPPPLAGRSKPRREETAAFRPPSPLPLEPVGAPPPQGMAWPPPQGDPTVCLVRETKGRELTTKCGRYIKLPKGDPACKHASIWMQDVTCQRCNPEQHGVEDAEASAAVTTQDRKAKNNA